MAEEHEQQDESEREYRLQRIEDKMRRIYRMVTATGVAVVVGGGAFALLGSPRLAAGAMAIAVVVIDHEFAGSKRGDRGQ
jgi:uncharacterized membrane protein YgaE (UPF0421/DUF939 family)